MSPSLPVLPAAGVPPDLALPLIVAPSFHERIWGRRDLRAYYPECGLEPVPVGEAWLTGNTCRLAATPEWDLARLARTFGRELFGGVAIEGFPILVKMLFTEDRLSVQVHPDDAYAARHGLGRGKTEMWHILAAASGARLALNLRAGVTLETFAVACRSGCGAEMLAWRPAAAGESYFVPAGTIHALGAGLVVCEVQQQSDITFRLDDYGRRDGAGRLRPLHLDCGLAVAQARTAAGLRSADGRGLLAECAYFTVCKFTLVAGVERPLPPAFRILVALAGAPALRRAAAAFPLPPARATLMAASARGWTLGAAGSGESNIGADVLEITLPAAAPTPAAT